MIFERSLADHVGPVFALSAAGRGLAATAAKLHGGPVLPRGPHTLVTGL